jgi:O-antigen/teichoic acid export membrane protein
MTSATAHPRLDEQFCAIPTDAELKRRSVLGSVVSLASQGLRWILSLASIAILARLLTPEDFGLVAMVYAIIDFAELCMDLGLGTATIQAPQITSRQASTLFWLNLALSGVITTAIAAAAPLISLLYHEPRLTQLVLVLSLGFVIMGLGMQHRALLNRQMRFGALSGIELTALAASTFVAIAAAWFGLRYWSLVLRHFVYITIGCAGAWLISGWRPQLPSRGSGIRGMLAFGANLTGFYFLQYFARNMDRVLLGWYATTRQVGLYDRICHLALVPVMQITWPLTRVAIPALATLRNDPQRYRRYYRRGLLLVATMGMPAVAFLFVAVEDVIRFMLGPNWLEAAPVLRALAPAAFATTFSVATTWVYNSLGRADRQLRWGILTSASTIAGFIIGVHWGAVGVAAAMSIVTCCLTLGPPGIAYCYRQSPLKMTDILAALWRPLAAATGAALSLYLTANLIPTGQNAFLRLLSDAAIYIPCYILLWCLLPNGMTLVREIIDLAREMRTQNTAPNPTPVPQISDPDNYASDLTISQPQKQR